ncbi:STAS domain-containing protein [Paenibacillus athensensis]|uniref:Anti-sigma factor antagonist n=1 Tax=Paenibacillus athensensis TaxID=1967502 RepID=A0A4Y8PQB1_9BACL|nr:STAS domain-containing protein [Paenibacillus athensensis]MCD1260513.1 STAS domain-containing protein [Paenibacillus athensensis]
MNINEQAQGDVVLLTIGGRLDGNSSSTLEARFLQLVEAGKSRFVFDLGELEYVSSAGLRSLLVAAKKTKTIQGKLALTRMTDNVKEVFDMSGFSAIFSIYPTADEALDAVR